MSWFRPFETVLFCHPTPGSTLAQSLRKIADEEGRRGGPKVKVVERCGTKLSSQLPGLQEEQLCDQEDCFLHQSWSKGDHNREGVGGGGDCRTCQQMGPSSQPDKKGTQDFLLYAVPTRLVGTCSHKVCGNLFPQALWERLPQLCLWEHPACKIPFPVQKSI